MSRKLPELRPVDTYLVSLCRSPRARCFFADDDYLFFLNAIADASKVFRLHCHAYAVLPDEIKLILSNAETLVVLLREVTQRYDAYVSRRYKTATGDWRVRLQALEQADSAADCALSGMLLTAMRYVEMAPVRTGLAQHPADYEWSSYRVHAYGEYSRILLPHEAWRALHRNLDERRFIYRTLFESELTATELASIELPSEPAHQVCWTTEKAKPLLTSPLVVA